MDLVIYMIYNMFIGFKTIPYWIIDIRIEYVMGWLPSENQILNIKKETQNDIGTWE